MVDHILRTSYCYLFHFIPEPHYLSWWWRQSNAEKPAWSCYTATNRNEVKLSTSQF